MINSTVTKIVLTKSKQISSIEFIYKNVIHKVKVRKEAILSAGSVNSPQILLLSGIGPKDALNKVNIYQVHNLPGVGQNLQHHVSFFLNYELTKQKDTNELDFLTLYNYLQKNQGPMTSTGMAQVTARLSSSYVNDSEHNPDIQIFFSGYLANCSKTGNIGELQDSKSVHSGKTFSINPLALRPKSRGYIALNTNDPLEPPLMNPRYLSNPYDIKILIEGIRISQKLANATILKKQYGIKFIKETYGNCSNQHKYDSDEFWECAIRWATGPENHHVGSCKMGPKSDSLAVVDSKLNVYGIKGLRVADASIMPSVVSGNPHATCVMIGEKAAEEIYIKWGRAQGN